MAADLAAKAIAAEIEARKSADALIIAEQGRWYAAVIRPLLAQKRRRPSTKREGRLPQKRGRARGPARVSLPPNYSWKGQAIALSLQRSCGTCDSAPMICAQTPN
jgi:hypothetical protein